MPADFKGDEAAFTIETPDGQSAPARLAVLRPGAFIEESEDNGSFAKPQVVTLPTTVRGSIKAAQDVDVFAFEGKAGQRVTAEILAARLGSPLDATLTLWNASNTLLASADDSAQLYGGSGMAAVALLYAGKHALEDPALSPLRSDLGGWPPALCLTSGRDFLLGATAALCRGLDAAGGAATLHLFNGLPHAFWAYVEAPESDAAFKLMAHFLQRHLGAKQ